MRDKPGKRAGKKDDDTTEESSSSCQYKSDSAFGHTPEIAERVHGENTGVADKILDPDTENSERISDYDYAYQYVLIMEYN